MIATQSDIIYTKTKEEFLSVYREVGSKRGIWIIWIDKGVEIDS